MQEFSNAKSEKMYEKIAASGNFSPYITYMRTIPAREGISVPLPDSLHPELKAALGRHGINSLYSHQAEAWESVRDGNNTVIVTPTASGKTLCYNLPVMQALLDEPKARALYLYPTKPTDISVGLRYDGHVFATYPEIGDGWDVTALPSGKITNKADGREYSYLFWEATPATERRSGAGVLRTLAKLKPSL